MTPYYQDALCTIYHGDCREILPTIDPATVALVLTDPPYGVKERTNRKEVGRSNLAECNDFPPVYGDDEVFDPAHLLRFKRLVLFGGNYYAGQLPASPSWIVWDKRDGMTSNDNADVELAWTNLGGPADGWLMAAHPPCLKQHRPDAHIDGVALENPGDFEAPGRGRKVSGSAPGTPVKRASETTASDHSDGTGGDSGVNSSQNEGTT